MTELRRHGPPSRSVVSDAELAAVVREGWPRVTRVERSLSVYSTSATVEDVVVHLPDGSTVDLLLKDLSPAARLHGRLVGRPAFLVDPHRELVVYRSLLVPERDGTAACHAAVDDGDQRWLLLEKVRGVELYQVGDLTVWCRAAATVARLHAALVEPPDGGGPLVRHDEAYLRRWMDRAVAFAGQGSVDAAVLESLRPVHDAVVRGLLALPPVVVHGDLYASNVLVTAAGRVCPVDWELAGLAPAVVDLAALTSGGWTEDERLAMARAYLRAMRDRRWRPTEREFLRALDLARLQLCVQWLGWAADWTPPTEHSHDWLGEARRLADRLRSDDEDGRCAS